MEPGHEDREYLPRDALELSGDAASMEPGHEDREYFEAPKPPVSISSPQWSPVMKTGNTSRSAWGRSTRTGLNGARS